MFDSFDNRSVVSDARVECEVSAVDFAKPDRCDVVTIKCDKHMDFEQVREVLEEYKRQLAQSFLLNSAVTRDAERVTAEEIRYQAQELETAYGGVYSRFTDEWQTPLASLLLKREQINISDETIYPVIVTGLDTLSRLGDLDNYRMFMADCQAVAAMPEPMQKYLNIPGLISFLGTNRGVDYSQFILSSDQVRAQDQEMMDQQKQMMAAETGNEVVREGAKEIMKQDE